MGVTGKEQTFQVLGGLSPLELGLTTPLGSPLFTHPVRHYHLLIQWSWSEAALLQVSGKCVFRQLEISGSVITDVSFIRSSLIPGIILLLCFSVLH